MAYDSLLPALTEARTRQFQEELEAQRREEERRRREAQLSQQGLQTSSPAQQQSSMPSINPTQFMDMFGGGGAASGSGTGNAALNAWTGVGPGASSAGGAASGGASGGSGMMSGLASAGPWAALAAAIALNENYQGNIGNREGESFPLEYGITGRAFYKDKDVWGDKADDIIPGLGSGVRIAGGMSSPVDMFRADTWKDVGKELASGGVLGGLIKKLF
jgi:hypothetical protein